MDNSDVIHDNLAPNHTNDKKIYTGGNQNYQEYQMFLNTAINIKKLFLEDNDLQISSISPKDQLKILIDSMKNAGVNLDVEIDHNNYIFYRTVFRANPLQVDLRGIGKKSKLSHFMNASPLGNLSISLKEKNDSLTFIKPKRDLRLLNIMLINFIFGVQLKQGASYGEYSRGLFDFMNENTIVDYCVKNNYDGILTIDYVDGVPYQDVLAASGTTIDDGSRLINDSLDVTENLMKVIYDTLQGENSEVFVGVIDDNNENYQYAFFPEFYLINKKNEDVFDYLSRNDIITRINRINESDLISVAEDEYYSNVKPEYKSNNTRLKKFLTTHYNNLVVLPLTKLNVGIMKQTLSMSWLKNSVHIREITQDSFLKIKQVKDSNMDGQGKNMKFFIEPYIFKDDVYKSIISNLQNESCDFMELKKIATKTAYEISRNNNLVVQFDDNGEKKDIYTNSYLFKIILNYSALLLRDLSQSRINCYIAYLLLNKFTHEFTTIKSNNYNFREFIKNVIGMTNKYDDYSDEQKKRINDTTLKYLNYCRDFLESKGINDNTLGSGVLNLLKKDLYQNQNNYIQLHQELMKRYGLSNDDFFKFYLKGGGTLVLLSNLYTTYTPEHIRIEQFGDTSDFDFNVIINAYLEEDDYTVMYNGLIEVLRELGENYGKIINERFNTDNYMGNLSLELINIGFKFNQKTQGKTDTFSTIELGGRDQINTSRNSASGTDGYAFFQFKDIYNFKGYGTEFALLRLMLTFDTETYNEMACRTVTAVELIDISVIKYNAHEKLDSWKKASVKGIKTIPLYFNDNAGYINTLVMPFYDIGYAISDLELVVKENMETGKTDKLEKRKRRLKVLKDFECLYLINDGNNCNNLFKTLKYWDHGGNVPDGFVDKFVLNIINKQKYNIIYSEEYKLYAFCFSLIGTMTGIDIQYVIENEKLKPSFSPIRDYYGISYDISQISELFDKIVTLSRNQQHQDDFFLFMTELLKLLIDIYNMNVNKHVSTILTVNIVKRIIFYQFYDLNILGQSLYVFHSDAIQTIGKAVKNDVLVLLNLINTKQPPITFYIEITKNIDFIGDRLITDKNLLFSKDETIKIYNTIDSGLIDHISNDPNIVISMQDDHYVVSVNHQLETLNPFFSNFGGNIVIPLKIAEIFTYDARRYYKLPTIIGDDRKVSQYFNEAEQNYLFVYPTKEQSQVGGGKLKSIKHIRKKKVKSRRKKIIRRKKRTRRNRSNNMV